MKLSLIKNGQADGTSKYKMTGKDGKNTYFAEDGRILGIVDRYGNTINFQYESLNYYMDGHSINKKLISKNYGFSGPRYND
ncbi:hypothetical protein ACFSQ7_38320 [Paenibacillus rhizoplanae]